MERNREEERKQNLEKENKEGNENGTVKSCKGFLFYSSALKSHNRDPLCIGIPRSLPQDFSFVCAGYSLFMSKNEGSITKDGTKPQLPHCRGLAYLQHLAPPNPNPASAPAHVHSKGDHGVHQHQTRKSTYAVEDDFLNRFTRKANLIASRVARDMCRVGNNIKNNVEDILFSSRRPPK
ncbi:hypothetical protein E1A91_D11G201100v1 [Gossypium mustelinum]|uniref:DUF8204 domain-containing protein n=1 Tax=Gossypium mustelinum TaxID=34275 RepID=A0A5D2SV59_GOSMU|nr:hypothetical protein E1A91_D11G201100v1 [Gossypium mustelinum]